MDAQPALFGVSGICGGDRFCGSNWRAIPTSHIAARSSNTRASVLFQIASGLDHLLLTGNAARSHAGTFLSGGRASGSRRPSRLDHLVLVEVPATQRRLEGVKGLRCASAPLRRLRAGYARQGGAVLRLGLAQSSLGAAVKGATSKRRAESWRSAPRRKKARREGRAPKGAFPLQRPTQRARAVHTQRGAVRVSPQPTRQPTPSRRGCGRISR